jgi:hypothetical protein
MNIHPFAMYLKKRHRAHLTDMHVFLACSVYAFLYVLFLYVLFRAKLIELACKRQIKDKCKEKYYFSFFSYL